MSVGNPYLEFVAEFSRMRGRGEQLQLGRIASTDKTNLQDNAPRALIFSPHPDDECIIGGLALRLQRQASVKITNVAVTLGSKIERRRERLDELRAACHYVGFDLLEICPSGLENINVRTRTEERQSWNASVKAIAGVLENEQPHIIFFPHEFDWNTTHVGTHFLLMDALRDLEPAFETLVVETEFWGQMQSPNLIVESSIQDVADMVAGISFHIGEVRRNPYHLFLPAWMLDNVRRGTELVCGQGTAAPNLIFATLYRVSRWIAGRLEPAYPGGKTLVAADNPRSVFGCLKVGDKSDDR